MYQNKSCLLFFLNSFLFFFFFLGDYSQPLESFLFKLHPRFLKSRGCAKCSSCLVQSEKAVTVFTVMSSSAASHFAAPQLSIKSLGLLAELTVGGRVVGGVHLLRRAILRYLLHGRILRHVGSLYCRVGSNIRSWVSQ